MVGQEIVLLNFPGSVDLRQGGGPAIIRRQPPGGKGHLHYSRRMAYLANGIVLALGINVCYFTVSQCLVCIGNCTGSNTERRLQHRQDLL